ATRRSSTSTVPVARISELMVLYSILPVRTPMLCMRSGDNSTGVSGGAEPSGGVLMVKPSIGGCSTAFVEPGDALDDFQIQKAPSASATLSTAAKMKSLR